LEKGHFRWETRQIAAGIQGKKGEKRREKYKGGGEAGTETEIEIE
jgi:hypothetical protein